MEIKQSTRIQTSLLNGVDGASCDDAFFLAPFHFFRQLSRMVCGVFFFGACGVAVYRNMCY